MLKGSLVAMITPMLEDGSVDSENLGKLVDFHVDSGSDAIVSVGTTGESATLTIDEQIDVIRRTVALLTGAFRSLPALAQIPPRKRWS